MFKCLKLHDHTERFQWTFFGHFGAGTHFTILINITRQRRLYVTEKLHGIKLVDDGSLRQNTEQSDQFKKKKTTTFVHE